MCRNCGRYHTFTQNTKVVFSSIFIKNHACSVGGRGTNEVVNVQITGGILQADRQ